LQRISTSIGNDSRSEVHVNAPEKEQRVEGEKKLIDALKLVSDVVIQSDEVDVLATISQEHA
jgi:hypothetical protein